MNDSNARYIEAMAKLYGSDKPHTCQHPGCRTVTLGQFCLEHIETGEAVKPPRQLPTGE